MIHFFLFTLILTLPLSSFARTIPDHPQLEQFLKKYEGLNAGLDCESLLPLTHQIAREEKNESAFLLKTMKESACKVDFLAVGGPDFVNRDPEQMEKLLTDPKAKSALDVHSHPLLNVGYFSEGVEYQGEIMFADQAAIHRYRLSAEVYQKMNAAVSEQKIPGYNLSPPSVPDLYYANSDSPIPTSNIVLTTGGYWRYALVPGADKHKVREKIEDFSSYAMMYEMAHTDPAKLRPGQRERAQKLFDANMADPEIKRITDEWQLCSLELRRPFTIDAWTAHLAGDDRLLKKEFQDKLAMAARWSAVMKIMGFSLEFTPYANEMADRFSAECSLLFCPWRGAATAVSTLHSIGGAGTVFAQVF